MSIEIKDKLVTVEGLALLSDSDNIKYNDTKTYKSGSVGKAISDLSAISTATSDDVGKALKVKTVTDGKVSEWEFGASGGDLVAPYDEATDNTKIAYNTSSDEYEVPTMTEFNVVKEDLSGLQATALYVDTEGFICLKESD